MCAVMQSLPRTIARLQALLRLVAVALCLQISGMTHGLVDVLVSMDVVAAHADDCDDEGPGDCPPGCPTCHCTHYAGALPPPVRGPLLKMADVGEVLEVCREARPPFEHHPRSVFRPPRSDRSS